MLIATLFGEKGAIVAAECGRATFHDKLPTLECVSLNMQAQRLRCELRKCEIRMSITPNATAPADSKRDGYDPSKCSAAFPFFQREPKDRERDQ